MNAKLRSTLALSSIATLLTACGGGGGGSTTPPPGGGVTPPPAVTPGNLLKTMPANPFTAGTAEYNNFIEINRIRIAGGFGGMIDDPVMRQAAKAHENYAYLNYTVNNNPNPGPHNQTPGNPGFTGIDPQARCDAAAVGTAAEKNIGCGEVRAGVGGTPGQLNIMGLYAAGAVGHLQGILDYRANRMGMHTTDYLPISNQLSTSTTIDVGYRFDSMAMLDSDKANSIVGIYPFDGMTGVGLGVGETTQNGLPYANTVILVQTSELGINPTVTTFTLRKDGATQDTPARIIEGGQPTNGPGTEPTQKGWAILAATVLLDPNSKYTVTFSGQLNGVLLNKTWSFTTGTCKWSEMPGQPASACLAPFRK